MGGSVFGPPTSPRGRANQVQFSLIVRRDALILAFGAGQWLLQEVGRDNALASPTVAGEHAEFLKVRHSPANGELLVVSALAFGSYCRSHDTLLWFLSLQPAHH